MRGVIMNCYVESGIHILNDTTKDLENLNELGIYLARGTNIDALKSLKLIVLASETKLLEKSLDNNNVKNRNAAVYLLNGEQEGVNHGNLLEQAPVKAHMVHEHLMSVMNVTSIFDEYGHHENKSERINRIISGIL